MERTKRELRNRQRRPTTTKGPRCIEISQSDSEEDQPKKEDTQQPKPKKTEPPDFAFEADEEQEGYSLRSHNGLTVKVIEKAVPNPKKVRGNKTKKKKLKKQMEEPSVSSFFGGELRISKDESAMNVKNLSLCLAKDTEEYQTKPRKKETKKQPTREKENIKPVEFEGETKTGIVASGSEKEKKEDEENLHESSELPSDLRKLAEQIESADRYKLHISVDEKSEEDGMSRILAGLSTLSLHRPLQPQENEQKKIRETHELRVDRMKRKTDLKPSGPVASTPYRKPSSDENRKTIRSYQGNAAGSVPSESTAKPSVVVTNTGSVESLEPKPTKVELASIAQESVPSTSASYVSAESESYLLPPDPNLSVISEGSDTSVFWPTDKSLVLPLPNDYSPVIFPCKEGININISPNRKTSVRLTKETHNKPEVRRAIRVLSERLTSRVSGSPFRTSRSIPPMMSLMEEQDTKETHESNNNEIEEDGQERRPSTSENPSAEVTEKSTDSSPITDPPQTQLIDQAHNEIDKDDEEESVGDSTEQPLMSFINESRRQRERTSLKRQRMTLFQTYQAHEIHTPTSKVDTQRPILEEEESEEEGKEESEEEGDESEEEERRGEEEEKENEEEVEEGEEKSEEEGDEGEDEERKVEEGKEDEEEVKDEEDSVGSQEVSKGSSVAKSRSYLSTPDNELSNEHSHTSRLSPASLCISPIGPEVTGYSNFSVSGSVLIEDPIRGDSSTSSVPRVLRNFSRLSIGDVSGTPYYLRGRTQDRSPMDDILHVCQQTRLEEWTEAFSPLMLKKAVKIGEGVYGEVFRTARRSNESVALKVIPIEGNFKVNDEPQKSFEEILPEILISIEMSRLRDGERDSTPNFVEVISAKLVMGAYPPSLLRAWNEYDAKKGSENDSPDIFEEEQIFVVFEFGDGGCDFENYKISNPQEAYSIASQIVLALAVAESALSFEHRDLHIGNVLVKKTEEVAVSYRLKGEEMSVESCGVHVYIIDFTLSRLRREGCTLFTDLSADDELFKGPDDEYQFDIYRMMKEENQNEWKTFFPRTNILWLHYLLDKLLTFKKVRGRLMGSAAASPLLSIKDTLLDYTSCTQLSISPVFQEFIGTHVKSNC